MDWSIKIGRCEKGFICIVSRKLPNGSMMELPFVYESKEEFIKEMNKLVDTIASYHIEFE